MRSATKEAKPAATKEFAAYTAALARLERLKALLEEARRRRDVARNRSGSNVKKVVNSSIASLPSMGDGVFDDMARKIAESDGEISDSLMDRLRFGAPKPPFKDRYDAEEFASAEDASRRALLLERAVTVQERCVASEKKLAAAAVRGASQNRHSIIVRETVAAFLNFAAKVNEERDFFEELRAQDEAIPALLSPGPFPISLSADSEICRWIAAALGISVPEAQDRIANAAPREKELSR